MWITALLLPTLAAALIPRDAPGTYIRNIELPIMNGLVWSMSTVPHTERDAYWRINGVTAKAAPGSGEVVTDTSTAYFDNGGVDAVKTPRLVFTFPRGPMYFRGRVNGVAEGANLGVIEYYANGDRTEIPINYNQSLQDRGQLFEVMDSQLSGAASAAFILGATFQGSIQITHFGYNISVPATIPDDRDFVVAERINFVDGDKLSTDSRIDYRGGNYSVAKLKASKGSDTLAFLQGTPQNNTGAANASAPAISISVPVNTSAIQFNGGLGSTAAPKTIELIANAGDSETLDSWTLQGGMDNRTLGNGVQLFAALDPNTTYTAVISVEDGVLLGSVDFFTMSEMTRPKVAANAAKHGLSSGAIAGIVIGVVVGVVAIGLAVFFCLRSKRKTSTVTSSGGSYTSLNPRDNELQPMPFAATTPPAVVYQNEKSRSPVADTAQGTSRPTVTTAPNVIPKHLHNVTNRGFASPESSAGSTSESGNAELLTKSSILSHGSSSTPSRTLPPTPQPPPPALPSTSTGIHIEEDAGHLQTLPMQILPPNYNPQWEREHLDRASENEPRP